MQWIIYVKLFGLLMVATNAFWWGSSSNSRSDTSEEEELKRPPFHLIRTLTYHPILIPAPPAPPLSTYQYAARGYNYPPNIGHTQSPAAAAQPITTTRARTTPITTTTTTTTPEPSTTTTNAPPQEPQFQSSINLPFKQSAKSNFFSDKGYDFSPATSFMNRSPAEPASLQYVTNIAPMNVQFVPCMCPVEVRITNDDSQQEKQAEDSYIHRDFNNLDENVD